MTDLTTEKLLSAKEVASHLGLEQDSVWRLCRRWRRTGGREGLEHRKVGRWLRISPAAVERYKRDPLRNQTGEAENVTRAAT